jgi:hypothetical protein
MQSLYPIMSILTALCLGGSMRSAVEPASAMVTFSKDEATATV